MSDRPPSWDELPEFLTLREVSTLTRTSPSNCYEAARSGWLASIATKCGSQYRFSKRRLRILLEGEEAS